MASINIALECFGIIITALILFCCIIEKNLIGKQANIFMAMLITNILVLLCDLVTWIIQRQVKFELILYICNFFVYSFGYVITALFTYYLINYISQKKEISIQIARIIGFMCVIAIFLVIISLINHMYFTFENGIYIRGDWYWLSQTYPIIIVLIDMLIIIYCHRELGLHDTLSLLSYGILPIVAMIIQIYIFGITLLYIATTLSMVIIYLTIQVEQGKRLQRKEIELSQANISIMLSQIQPHFLFNSLTSISRLCDIDPQKAKKATLDFSQYLRGNLDSLKQIKPISFDTELSHIKTYLALEKIRFEEQLKIVYDLKTYNFMIPSLTIQPLIENAVKYGVGKKRNGGTVTLVTTENSEFIIIKVIDDGIGFNPTEIFCDNRSHIGISNVKNRLAIMSHATLEIDSQKGTGTTVTIKLPKGGAI